jgi:hypothetical protein
MADQPVRGEIIRADLHNHPLEAMGVGHVQKVTVDHVRRLAAAAVDGGVDVLAITEHGGWGFGRRVRQLADGLDLGVTILAGQEDWFYPVEVVEVELPSGAIFRFLAHPGAPAPYEPVLSALLAGLHGIEVENTNHQWHMPLSKLLDVAAQHDLLAMRSSDAHDLAQLGSCSLKCSVEELERRAAARVVEQWSLAERLQPRSRAIRRPARA